MEIIFYPADSRGYFDHGWLRTYHSFSFAGFYDESKINFGALRVLNDDYISPGMGFGKHPHNDMEIITIPLQGSLAHQDSEGNSQTISPGEVQVMSAGTGIFHSEYNASSTEEVNLLQIWILPDRRGHSPRYDQKKFEKTDRMDELQCFISPEKDGLWLNQDATFYWIETTKENELLFYPKSKDKGVYFFIIEGSATVVDQYIKRRDACAVSAAESINIKLDEKSFLLLIEVPLLF